MSDPITIGTVVTGARVIAGAARAVKTFKKIFGSDFEVMSAEEFGELSRRVQAETAANDPTARQRAQRRADTRAQQQGEKVARRRITGKGRQRPDATKRGVSGPGAGGEGILRGRGIWPFILGTVVGEVAEDAVKPVGEGSDRPPPPPVETRDMDIFGRASRRAEDVDIPAGVQDQDLARARRQQQADRELFGERVGEFGQVIGPPDIREFEGRVQESLETTPQPGQGGQDFRGFQREMDAGRVSRGEMGRQEEEELRRRRAAAAGQSTKVVVTQTGVLKSPLLKPLALAGIGVAGLAALRFLPGTAPTINIPGGLPRTPSPGPTPIAPPVTPPVGSPLPSPVGVVPALAPFANTAIDRAEQDCQIVTRRRRRKGKCREGFFKEEAGRTVFKTWRVKDCVTGTTISEV